MSNINSIGDDNLKKSLKVIVKTILTKEEKDKKIEELSKYLQECFYS